MTLTEFLDRTPYYDLSRKVARTMLDTGCPLSRGFIKVEHLGSTRVLGCVKDYYQKGEAPYLAKNVTAVTCRDIQGAFSLVAEGCQACHKLALSSVEDMSHPLRFRS